MSGVSPQHVHVSCCSQNLVDNLLARWNSLPASQQPPHLGERLEELFLEASMLEAVSESSVRCDGATVSMLVSKVSAGHATPCIVSTNSLGVSMLV